MVKKSNNFTRTLVLFLGVSLSFVQVSKSALKGERQLLAGHGSSSDRTTRWAEFWANHRHRAVKAAQKRRSQNRDVSQRARVEKEGEGNSENSGETSLFSTVKNPWVVGGLAVAAGVGYWFKDQILEVAESIGLKEPEDSDDEKESDEQNEQAIKEGWTAQQKVALGLAAVGGTAVTYYAYQNREALSKTAKERAEQAQTFVQENPGKAFVGGALAGALIYGIKSLSQQGNAQDEGESLSEKKKTASLMSFLQQTTKSPTADMRVEAQFKKLNNAFVASLKPKSLIKKQDIVLSQVKTAMNPTYYFCCAFENDLTHEQRQILWQLVQYFVMKIVPHIQLDAVEYAHYKFLGSLGFEHYDDQLFEAYRQFAAEKTIAYYSPMEMLSDEERKARKEFITAVVQARQKGGL